MSSQAELTYLNSISSPTAREERRVLLETHQLSDELLALAQRWRVDLGYLLMDDPKANAAGIINLLKGSWGTIPVLKEIDRLCELIIEECPNAYRNWVTKTTTMLEENTEDDMPVRINAVVKRLWTHDSKLGQMVQQKGVIFEK